ncbi:hypothetical protein OX000_33835, partial [Pseudomonas aeruginosa]
MPLLSVTVAVRVLVDVPSAVIVVGEAATVSAAADPAKNIKGTDPEAAPLVAVTVAPPMLVELVSTTVATPWALVLVELLASVPAVVDQATGVPAATGLPLVSVTVAVRVLVDEPSAVIEDGEASRARPAADPAVSVTAAVPLASPTEARTTKPRATVPLVSTTVATPWASVALELLERLPPVVTHETTVPGATGFPLASRTVAVRVLVDEPSAGIEDGEASTEMFAADPAVKVTAAVSLPAPAEAE